MGKNSDPGTYGMADDPPPKRRFRHMPGASGHNNIESRSDDRPTLRKFIGHDPFPWVLALCVLVWVGLGLGARRYPMLGFGLVGAGLIVILLSQIWLYISIYEDDRKSALLSFLFNWYRLIYLYMNPELTWRPTVLAIVGVLMCFTGMGLGLNLRR